MFVGLIGEAIGFLFQMKQLTNKMRTRLKIVGATATAVFSLASVFTATLAWFASNQNVTASAGSISIQAEKAFHLIYITYIILLSIKAQLKTVTTTLVLMHLLVMKTLTPIQSSQKLTMIATAM